MAPLVFEGEGHSSQTTLHPSKRNSRKMQEKDGTGLASPLASSSSPPIITSAFFSSGVPKKQEMRDELNEALLAGEERALLPVPTRLTPFLRTGLEVELALAFVPKPCSASFALCARHAFAFPHISSIKCLCRIALMLQVESRLLEPSQPA